MDTAKPSPRPPPTPAASLLLLTLYLPRRSLFSQPLLLLPSPSMEALFIDRLIYKEDDLHKMPCLLRRSVSFMVPEMGWDAMVREDP
jgi:hypothetical protein